MEPLSASQSQSMSKASVYKPSVFISYSHLDEKWKDRLKQQLAVLEMAEQIVLWDDRQIDGGDKWYPEIEAAMAKAAVAVCLISENFLSSAFCVKEEIPYLLKRAEEHQLLFIPVLLRPCSWQVFRWLSETQMLPRDGKSVAIDFKDENGSVAFSQVTGLIVKKINKPDYQPPTHTSEYLPPELLNIEHLPVTGAELFGREKELKQLDDAWAADEINIVSFIAWGGVGKSTLINKWLAYMAEENYKTAQRVFAWSFYSQGTSEQVSSADAFIMDALEFFGDENPTVGSAWSKGQRLAELIQQQPTLLILDGMEPLQSSLEEERGKIKDPALTMLMRVLAINNNGLCVVTSRESLTDISKFKNKTLQLDLDTLSADAGRALLRVGGVTGSDKALEDAVKQFGYHALAINLLPVYLGKVDGHGIAAVSTIADLAIAVEQGRHPRRVIAAIAERFIDKSEGDLLKLLGCFDRPADMAAIKQMIAPPVIVGLTDNLCDKGDGVLLTAINTLRGENLLADASKHRPDTLDCHPLIREHFGDMLQHQYPDIWQQAHGRLYTYYKQLPEKQLPDTLVEMEPLFAAVKHGCLSGQHQAAMDEVYYPRIKRKGEHYSTKKLGAFGADLSCLSHFFQRLWDKPAVNLTDDDKAVILSWAGFRLRAVGRLAEAAEPMKAGLEMLIEDKVWKSAAAAASNLSELYLTLGEVALALQYGEQSVSFADRSEDDFEMESDRTTHADALHQRGQHQAAEQLFSQAEAMQQKRQADFPYLYSLPGFRYCDLLLSLGQTQAVFERVKAMFTWRQPSDSLLGISLENLSMGKALMLQSLQNQTADFTDAQTHLHQAVEGLRESGAQHRLPWGLLARATLHQQQKAWQLAWTDLNETQEIAEYGEMKLHLTDYHLAVCRMIHAQLAEAGEPFEVIENNETLNLSKDEMQARFNEHLKQAAVLVEETGYHRRDDEVKGLENL